MVDLEKKSRFVQRQTKQLVFAWAVFDQKDGGMDHHYIGGDMSRECAGREEEERKE